MINTHDAVQAVIYARVSGTKQTTLGDGLNSQEARCREYASYKGLSVERIFTDDLSGGLIDRPGMQEMLTYLRKQKHPIIVIIDDISRLARGLEAHLRLRAAIAEAGGLLQSPTVEFGDDPDSNLVENLLASVSQHQREKNAEQTKNRMRGRLLNGYWVFHAPLGYKFERVKGHGKLIVPVEPVASIIKEALEGFASDRFVSQAEVGRFLDSKPDYPKDTKRSEIHPQNILRMLRQPIYAGHIALADWDVALRKGQHQGLISFETWMRIQDKLKAGKKAAARADLSPDFPLRGYVVCGACDHPMTGAWSKGKYRHYAYYFCQNPDCDQCRKSIPKVEVEEPFESMLKHMQPSASLTGLLHDMLKDLWDQRIAGYLGDRKALARQLSKIEQDVDQLADRIVEAQSKSVASAFERKIEKLELERLQIEEKLANKYKPSKSFKGLYEHALKFLSNPWNIWEDGNLNDRRALLKITFTEPLAFTRHKGYRTPKLSLPFRLLGGNFISKNHMVPLR